KVRRRVIFRLRILAILSKSDVIENRAPHRSMMALHNGDLMSLSGLRKFYLPPGENPSAIHNLRKRIGINPYPISYLTGMRAAIPHGQTHGVLMHAGLNVNRNLH